jgi:hypothetical protein
VVEVVPEGIEFFLVAGISNLWLWKNREVALMVTRKSNMMNLRLITTCVVLDKQFD